MWTVFYAWQSDIPGQAAFIEGAVKEAVRILSARRGAQLAVDRDTKGEPGTPHILQTILSKIDRCRIFVADVTIVNRACRSHGVRATPNPNVFLELGYALQSLGRERVIPVMNLAYGQPNDLPFDLDKYLLQTYKLGPTEPAETAQKQALIDKLVTAMEIMLPGPLPFVGKIARADRDALIDSLRPYKGRKVAIVTTLPKREKHRDVQQAALDEVASIFRDAGWEVHDRDVELETIPEGLVLMTLDQDYAGGTEPDFGPIEAAFGAAGWAYERRRHRSYNLYTAVTTIDPVVYVGPAYD